MKMYVWGGVGEGNTKPSEKKRDEGVPPIYNAVHRLLTEELIGIQVTV